MSKAEFAECTDVSVTLERGILSCWVYLEGLDKTWGQGFGGYDLRGKVGAQYLELLMTALKVERLDQIKGKIIRFKRQDDGWNSQIVQIGHRSENSWFNPKKDVCDDL